MKRAATIAVSAMLMVLSTIITSIAQKDWEDKFNGYVVTPDSTVIHGYIKFGTASPERGAQINLLKKPGDKPQVFYTFELRGYAHRKDTFEIHHNLQPYLDDKTIIRAAEARLIQRGNLTQYEVVNITYSASPLLMPPPAPGHTRVGIQPVAVTDLIYVVVESNGDVIVINKKNFIDAMHQVLPSDDPQLAAIDSKDLHFKDLKQVIKKHNSRYH